MQYYFRTEHDYERIGCISRGWMDLRLVCWRRTRAAHYLVSAVSLALGIPAMCVALFASGRPMVIGIFVAEFLLLLNTGPLNAAVINSVGPHVRAAASRRQHLCLPLAGGCAIASSHRLHLGQVFAARCFSWTGRRDCAVVCHTVFMACASRRQCA